MAVVANRRSVITLYSAPDCPRCHRIRIILAEKDVAADIVSIENPAAAEDLADLNPYAEAPTLVDRDLPVYGLHPISEYLDERFPHPPLMPVDPIARAVARLSLYRIERDWYEAIDAIRSSSGPALAKARKAMRESLIASQEIFELKPYFLSDEYSMVDTAIAPVMWRLPSLGLTWDSLPNAIREYAERVCTRPAFESSLTDAERELPQK